MRWLEREGAADNVCMREDDIGAIAAACAGERHDAAVQCQGTVMSVSGERRRGAGGGGGTCSPSRSQIGQSLWD